MKKILSIFSIVAIAMMTFSCKNEGKSAQEGEETVVEAAALVEVKPTFNGGDANDFLKFVEENIVYPEKAKENGDQGKVYLTFVVDATGKVGNVKVLKGVSE